MSKNTCDYSFDPTEWNEENEVDSPLDSYWSCPHAVYNSYDYCVFHIQGTNPEIEVSFTTISQRLQTLIESSEPGANLLVGATIKFADLSYLYIDSESTKPLLICHSILVDIDLSDSVIQRSLKFQRCYIGALRSRGAEYQGELEFHDVLWSTATNHISLPDPEYNIVTGRFDCNVDFRGASFESDILMRNVVIDDTATFRDATFHEQARFNFCDFRHFTSFLLTRFLRRADFSHSNFHGWGQFDNSKFGTDATFEATVFADRSTFAFCEFNDTALFASTHFKSGSNFETSSFGGNLVFDHAIFCDDMIFYNASIESLEINHSSTSVSVSQIINHSLFEGPFFFNMRGVIDSGTLVTDDISQLTPRRWSTTSDVEFNLEGAHIASGEFTTEDRGISFNLTDASIGDIGLQPADEMWERFHLLRTDLDGFDFTTHKQVLRKRDWIIHKPVSLEKPERLADVETTYLKAKSNANKIGDTESASEFLFKEFKYRRKRHWKNSDFGKWLFNVVFGAVSGYGERSSRVVVTSVAVIVIFAEVYGNFFSFSDNYSENIVLSYTTSVQSFVTLLFGSGNSSAAPAFRFLAAVEGFLGTFLIALFVFTLTKTIRH